MKLAQPIENTGNGLKLIVAVSNNNVIGAGNSMPWHIPSDLRYFKAITEGHTVIMGRKCWDSIPEKFRPLSNRKNVVLTRQENIVLQGADTINSFERAIAENPNAFIVGGGEIYKMGFEIAEELYLTRVLHYFDGEIVLEGFDEKKWDLEYSSDIMSEGGYNFVFQKYKKHK